MLGAEKEPSCTVQLVLGVLEKLAKLFLCLKQDHGFGGGQGSPSRVLSHMPAAWSAAEKGPAGKEEGCLSFPNVQPYADAEKDSGEEKGVLSFPSVQQFLALTPV